MQDIISSGINILPSELYDCTISELSSLIHGHNTNLRLQKMFYGTLTASVYNTAHKKNRRMLTWMDIYPDKTVSSAHTSNQPMTNEEIKRKLMSAFGGVR